MNRQDYLNDAEDLICRQRQSVHGDAENSFALVASYWNVFMLNKHGKNLSPADVAVMMTLFKLARWQMNPNHQDNVLDGIGYLALAGEIQDRDAWKPE